MTAPHTYVEEMLKKAAQYAELAADALDEGSRAPTYMDRQLDRLHTQVARLDMQREQKHAPEWEAA